MMQAKIWKAAVMVIIAIVTTACPKSRTSKSAAASQAASLTLVSSAYGLAPNAQANITATGGTGIYSSFNASVGTLQPLGNGKWSYTAPSSVTGVAAAVITVTDSAGTVGKLNIAITGASNGNVLSMYSTASPIPVGGTVTLTVFGGTGPYTWQIVTGGGTLGSTTGSQVTYTAPAAAGSVTVMVADSANHNLSATIPIAGQSTTTCSGYYAINSQGRGPGTLFLAPSAGGAITGSLSDGSGTFTLSGACTATNVTFTLNDGTVFTGQFYYTNFDPYIASMVGTYSGGRWVAVPRY